MTEGRALAEIVAATRRVLQVGHVFRFHPVTAALRERLTSGNVGAIRYCTGRFAGFKRPRVDVGVTMTDAIHYFDLFAYLLGEAPIAVTATLRDYLGRGMDDCSFATVEYGRFPAFVEAGYFAPGTYRDCVIVGERATLAGDFGSSEVRVHANQHVKGAGGWKALEGSGRSPQGKRQGAAPPRARAVPRRRRAPNRAGGRRGSRAPRAQRGGGGASFVGARPPRHPLRDRLDDDKGPFVAPSPPCHFSDGLQEAHGGPEMLRLRAGGSRGGVEDSCGSSQRSCPFRGLS